ncbi:MAG: DUF58 domain-containing protein [Lachnospiraceae bacterium]|nr:DUF58 domain-containing protein [Lachnospiraceae bacterium]
MNRFKKHWEEGLKVELSFDKKGVDAGTTCALSETIVNHKTQALPVLSVSISADNSFEFTDELKEDAQTFVSDNYYRTDTYSLKPMRRIRKDLYFKPQKRGYFKISDPKIIAKDFFMLNEYSRVYEGDASIYVYPKKVRVPEAERLFLRIQGQVQARRALEEDPFTFRSIREYRPGDPERYINWKASARNDSLLVNTHDSTFSVRVGIITDANTFSVVDRSVMQEKCISVTSSVCMMALRTGAQVGVYSNFRDFENEREVFVNPGSNRQHLGVVDRVLARVNTDLKTDSFDEYLDRFENSMETFTEYIVIMAEYQDKAFEKINQLKNKGYGISGLVIKSRETGGKIYKLPEGFITI